jgi:hypothetical protein
VNREKSKLPALTTICFPLFDAVGNIFQELQPIISIAKQNIKTYEQIIVSAKMKEEEEAEAAIAAHRMVIAAERMAAAEAELNLESSPEQTSEQLTVPVSEEGAVEEPTPEQSVVEDPMPEQSVVEEPQPEQNVVNDGISGTQVSETRVESEVVEEPLSELIEIKKDCFGKIQSDSDSSISRLDSADSFAVGAPFTQEDEFADDENSGSDGL